jgi:TolA-binding protein
MTKDSNNDSDPLPEDLRSFLDAERDIDAPESETRDRLFTRLTPLLLPPSGGVTGAGDVGADAAAPGAAGAAVKAGLGAKLIVPAICTALGAAGGAATHAYLAASRAEVPAARVQPAQAVTAAPVAAPAEAASSEAPAASAGSGAGRPTQEISGGSLRAERLLLESATAALLRGDTTSAMATLQKHARQYPRGALTEEREVLLVKVLRAQGDEKAAEQRVSEFKRKFPSSLQQGAVDKPGSAK